jgi:ribonuclease III
MNRRPSRWDEGLKSINILEKKLSYTFHDRTLLEKALTHPSAGGLRFQRLEFLGDRVLGLTIAHWLYELFPDDFEGHLTKRLANMVNRNALNRVAESLNLAQHITSDTEMAYNSRVMADCCEALLGAIYLDSGLSAAQKIIRAAWEPLLDNHATPPAIDAKSALQEYLQSQKHPLPCYHLVSQNGPSHSPIFHIRLDVNETQFFTGIGQSKREAEQIAAQHALDFYQALNGS